VNIIPDPDPLDAVRATQWDLPGRPGMVGVALRRARRRRRSRLITSSAAVTVVVALAAAGVVLARPAHEHPAAVIVGAPSSPTATGTDACKSAQLSGTAGLSGADHGRATQQILLKNSGTSTCSLSGFPGVLGSTDESPDRRALNPTPSGSSSTLSLSPGDVAAVTVSVPGTCPNFVRQPAFTTLVLTLPSNQAVTTGNTYVSPFCGGYEVTSYTAEPPPAAAATLTTASPLRASILLPASAARGSTITYTLTLYNDTNGPVPLSPCPSFEQRIRAGDSPVASTGNVPCTSPDVIPAHGSQSFQIPLQIPSTPVGSAKLGIQLSNGIFAGGRLHLV